METESGAKIAIRGKGSVKEGKGRSDAAHSSNQEEDLHCLIMADTEEKVNKAKKLIHNIIETVRFRLPCFCICTANCFLRLLRFLKAKTSSSATSCVSLLPLTVPYVMTRTKPARTAVRSAIANMIALRSRTTPPTLSAVSAVTLVTWLGIVLTGRGVQAGEMMVPVLPAPLVVLAALVAAMPWTASTRYAFPISTFLSRTAY